MQTCTGTHFNNDELYSFYVIIIHERSNVQLYIFNRIIIRDCQSNNKNYRTVIPFNSCLNTKTARRSHCATEMTCESKRNAVHSFDFLTLTPNYFVEIWSNATPHSQ